MPHVTLSPQRRKILAALAHDKSVTRLTAFHQGIGNLGDVVMRLRRQGWDIRTVTDRDINGHQYTKYKLVEHQRPAAADRVKYFVAS